MSSSGYPQIEFGYDDASDEEDDEEEDDDDSTNPDVQSPNGLGIQRPNLVSEAPHSQIPWPVLYALVLLEHIFDMHCVYGVHITTQTDIFRLLSELDQVHVFNAPSELFCISLWNIARRKLFEI